MVLQFSDTPIEGLFSRKIDGYPNKIGRRNFECGMRKLDREIMMFDSLHFHEGQRPAFVIQEYFCPIKNILDEAHQHCI